METSYYSEAIRELFGHFSASVVYYKMWNDPLSPVINNVIVACWYLCSTLTIEPKRLNCSNLMFSKQQEFWRCDVLQASSNFKGTVKLASSEIGSVYNTRYLGLNTIIYLNKSAGVLKKSFGIFFLFLCCFVGVFLVFCFLVFGGLGGVSWVHLTHQVMVLNCYGFKLSEDRGD